MVSGLLLVALESAPSAFFHVIDDVRPEKYEERLAEDRFNLIEVVAHLSDIEDVFLDRMRLAHEQPGADCFGFDPTERAIEKNYASRDLHHELDVYKNRRNDTLDFLRNLQPGEKLRTVIHPSWGEISIEQIAHGLSSHDMFHLEQASRYLR